MPRRNTPSPPTPHLTRSGPLSTYAHAHALTGDDAASAGVPSVDNTASRPSTPTSDHLASMTNASAPATEELKSPTSPVSTAYSSDEDYDVPPPFISDIELKNWPSAIFEALHTADMMFKNASASSSPVARATETVFVVIQETQSTAGGIHYYKIWGIYKRPRSANWKMMKQFMHKFGTLMEGMDGEMVDEIKDYDRDGEDLTVSIQEGGILTMGLDVENGREMAYIERWTLE